MALDVDALARRVQAELQQRARPAVARQARRFFKEGEGIDPRGVRAAEVKRIAAAASRELRQAGTVGDVVRFAEQLLASRWFEDRAAALYVAKYFTKRFGEREFARSERWLRFVGDWATCDALTGYVLGPQLVADVRRVRRVFAWARSPNRWHRRAAAASLIPAARLGLYEQEIFRLARRLYRDPDEMVQKAVGWLLKEASKARRRDVVSFLLSVRSDAPRLVMRYASEKLPRQSRQEVLRKPDE